jgi:hypothetical protein
MTVEPGLGVPLVQRIQLPAQPALVVWSAIEHRSHPAQSRRESACRVRQAQGQTAGVPLPQGVRPLAASGRTSGRRPPESLTASRSARGTNAWLGPQMRLMPRDALRRAQNITLVEPPTSRAKTNAVRSLPRSPSRPCGAGRRGWRLRQRREVADSPQGCLKTSYETCAVAGRLCMPADFHSDRQLPERSAIRIGHDPCTAKRASARPRVRLAFRRSEAASHP